MRISELAHPKWQLQDNIIQMAPPKRCLCCYRPVSGKDIPVIYSTDDGYLITEAQADLLSEKGHPYEMYAVGPECAKQVPKELLAKGYWWE